MLATALARDATVRRAFPDGVYWVALGERPDPVAAQAALARLIGIDPVFRTVEDGQATLREALLERRVLVVIDDVWSAADAEALLVTDVTGRVVLTTRHPDASVGPALGPWLLPGRCNNADPSALGRRLTPDGVTLARLLLPGDCASELT